MDGTNRLDSLTGLRAAAALGVFISHIDWVLGAARLNPIGTLHRITEAGGLGVSFFFVLSGFVLAWSARPHDRPRNFYGRRVARIYPAHLAMWVLFGVLLVAGLASTSEFDETVLGAVASLLLVQAWFPSFTIHFAWNSPSWTLSVEMFFYLCFPLLIRPLRRLGGRALPALALACAAFPFLLAAVLRAAHLRESTAEFWWRVMPVMRLPEFVLGMTLALLVRQRRLPTIALLPATVVTVIAWFLTRWVPYPFANAVVVAVVAVMIVAAAQRDLAGRPSFWSRPVVVHLGVISYAFYLVHELTIRAARHLWPGYEATPAAATVVVLACLAASVVLAEGLYHLIERPAERWLRGRLSPGAGPPAIDPSVTSSHDGPAPPEGDAATAPTPVGTDPHDGTGSPPPS